MLPERSASTARKLALARRGPARRPRIFTTPTVTPRSPGHELGDGLQLAPVLVAARQQEEDVAHPAQALLVQRRHQPRAQPLAQRPSAAWTAAPRAARWTAASPRRATPPAPARACFFLRLPSSRLPERLPARRLRRAGLPRAGGPRGSAAHAPDALPRARAAPRTAGALAGRAAGLARLRSGTQGRWPAGLAPRPCHSVAAHPSPSGRGPGSRAAGGAVDPRHLLQLRRAAATPLSFSPATTCRSAALRRSSTRMVHVRQRRPQLRAAPRHPRPLAPASARSSRPRRSFTVDSWAKSR